jgi:ATP-dependent Clp protease ATP-binding subunit ClpC
VQVRLEDHGLSLRLTEAAREYLAEKGYDPNLGARPLRRVIQSEIEDALSEGVLAGQFDDDALIEVDMQDSELVFHPAEEDDEVEVMGMESGGTPPQPMETVLN